MACVKAPGEAHHQHRNSPAQSQTGGRERLKVKGRVKGQFSDGSSDVENRMRTWWQPQPFFLPSILNLSPEMCLCLSVCLSITYHLSMHLSSTYLLICLIYPLSSISYLLLIFLSLPFSPFFSFLPFQK